MSKYKVRNIVVYDGKVCKVLEVYPNELYMVGSFQASGPGSWFADLVSGDELRKGYRVNTGTVQAFVQWFSDSPYIHHFGPAQYDRDKPIIRDWMREAVKPIIDALNAGTMTEDEARKALDKI